DVRINLFLAARDVAARSLLLTEPLKKLPDVRLCVIEYGLHAHAHSPWRQVRLLIEYQRTISLQSALKFHNRRCHVRLLRMRTTDYGCMIPQMPPQGERPFFAIIPPYSPTSAAFRPRSTLARCSRAA